MMNPEKFKKNKYLALENLIPNNICKIITKYALLQEEVSFKPEGPGTQVEDAHSVYSDTLMETMLHFLLPHMEGNTGKRLCPTYSYYRVYRPGMTLKKHIDRPACEISTTVCFGSNYQGVSDNYRWGMYVGENTLIEQNPGDLIVYNGCEIEHWRDEFQAGAGSYQVQAFFHYIDKDGPFYPEHAFDKRPGIGWKLGSKQLNN
jgi:hypothetical protein